ESGKIVAGGGSRWPQRRVVDGQITGNAPLEDIDRIGAESSQSIELELHEYRRARLLRRRRQALADDAESPAPTIVLQAHDGLQSLGVDQRVIPARDHRPVVEKRP